MIIKPVKVYWDDTIHGATGTKEEGSGKANKQSMLLNVFNMGDHLPSKHVADTVKTAGLLFALLKATTLRNVLPVMHRWISKGNY
jgi:hypothetical protein